MKIVKNIMMLLMVLGINSNSILAKPHYASNKTKEVIEKLIKAHGGIDKWKNAQTISYDNIFFNPGASKKGDPWWISHEIIDQKTRNVYQHWPIYNSKLVYDGKNVWTDNWVYGNPPNLMSHFFYYFLNLPWLSQDDNVKLSDPIKGSLPGLDKEYITVEMNFTEVPALGKTTNDKFILFIDPDTYLLQGYHYYIGFGAILDAMKMPPEMEIFGPMVRVFQNITEVDGLIFPTRFYTTNTDGEPIYGYHTVINYSLNKKFDNSWLKKTANAVIDKSSAKRKK